MPAKTLPTFTAEDVASHNSNKSCYVTLGNKVFDVTDFVDSHPGGSDLVLRYAGCDVATILEDEISHHHSEAAYEVLDDSLIGFLATPTTNIFSGNEKEKQLGDAPACSEDGEKFVYNSDGVYVHPRTGLATAEDLSKETDYNSDYKTHKFLDLNQPLLLQVFFGGFSKEFYLDQVHRPRHYKGGQSAPLFGNFLEPLSLTPWWLIPILWVPVVAYLTYVSSKGFSLPLEQASYWVLGCFIWSLVEYVMHRFLFHLDYYLPDNRYCITLHFLLHGVHHYLPMDKYRLVMPPALFAVLVTPFWKLVHTVFFWNWYVATTVFCGGMFGYICYDLTHYFLHHQNLPLWYKELKKYHLQHHFLDYENGFGVTSRFWDRIFGTELLPPASKIN